MPSEDEIFADAIELSPDERDAFTHAACAGDAGLQARVGKLLGSYERAQAFFDRRVASPPAALSGEKAGDRIGRYILVAPLGEGGCGVVWRAEQRDPVRRDVALKIIKLGMDTREVITRFEAERQALALMSHANIARVFDGGATELGRPYFVMELVPGVSITKFCEERGLGIEARIALLILVCEAVQHAHEKGIIHRDLKPSNILVTDNESERRTRAENAREPLVSVKAAAGVPKIIDFGIAKATRGRISEHTLHTAVHQLVGTPAYMSPEQVSAGSEAVDTRSDIYSLGVLLYELLTGRTPFDREVLGNSSYDEIRTMIQTVDPVPPSARVRAANRQVAVQLRRDLDWIVLRCLEKDRARRYDSAAALARDLRRYLAHEPVAARPPSAGYVLGKLVRRHRVAFAGISVIAATLVLGASVSAWQAVRATRAEREQSQLRLTAESAREAEAALRAEAERRQTEESHRWGRFDFANATRLLEQGKVRDGVAFLVHAGQLNPENRAVAVRLLTTLASRTFVRPLEPVTMLPAPRLAEQRVGRHGNFTRDGRSFGVLCADGVYRLVNVGSGLIEREIPVGRAATGAEIVGPWLKVLTDRRRGEFWELSSGQRAGEWPAPDDVTIESGASTSDGRWVARVEGEAIRIWEIAARREVLTIRAGNRPRGLNFSPDGTRLVAIARDGSWVKVWEMPGGELRTDIAMSKIGATAINPGLSHDNRTVAVLIKDGVQLFDAATSAPRGPLMRQEGHRAGNDDPVFTPDDRFVIMAGTDRLVHVWRVDTGAWAFPPLVHGGAVDEVRVLANGRLLLVPAADGTTHLWDLRTGEAAVELFKSAEGVESLDSVAPDGRTIVEVMRNGEVRRHRADNTVVGSLDVPAWLETQVGHWQPHRPASWCRIGKQSVREIDVAAGTSEREVARLPVGIASAWPAANGLSWLVRTEAGAWQAWRFEKDGVDVVKLDGFPSVSSDGWVEISPDGKRAVVTGAPDDRALHVWDLKSGIPAGPIVRSDDRIAVGIRTRDLSPDKRFVAAIAGGEGRVWEVATGKLVHRLQPLQRNARCLEFTPDGRQILMVEHIHGARLWDAESGQPRTEHLTHRGGGAGLVSGGFSPDGRRMMTYSWWSGSVVVRDLSTREPLGPEIEHAHELLLIPAWSPDGTRIATVGTDGLACVWDIATGAMLSAQPCVRSAGLPNPRGVGMVNPRLNQMSFSPDGRFLATTVQGQTTNLWPAPPAAEAPVPGWLLELATLSAGARVDNDGHVIDASADLVQWERIRREVESLPPRAPYRDWGRWLVTEPEQRNWAPSGGSGVVAGDIER